MILVRTDSNDEGTSGILVFGDTCLHTGELPWRDNQPNYSCIPTGKYVVQVRDSPKYGRVYHITGVRDRSYILFHQGNWFGDRTLGYKCNVNGCILLGLKCGKLGGQKAVLSSRLARTRLENEMDFEPFKLEIMNDY